MTNYAVLEKTWLPEYTAKPAKAVYVKKSFQSIGGALANMSESVNKTKWATLDNFVLIEELEYSVGQFATEDGTFVTAHIEGERGVPYFVGKHTDDGIVGDTYSNHQTALTAVISHAAQQDKIAVVGRIIPCSSYVTVTTSEKRTPKPWSDREI